MKLKQQLVITDPEAFLRGDYSSCFTLFNRKITYNDWVHCGEIEIDLSEVDTSKMVQTVADAIDEKVAKHIAIIEVLKNRKAELLALPAPDKDCEHENVEYIRAQPERADEPGNDAGYRCLECGEWLEEEDVATRRGI